MKTEEADHQKAVIEWAEWYVHKWPCLKFLYACPNEGKHKVQYRVHQKAMGVKAGVPDLFLPYPIKSRGLYDNKPEFIKCPGLYIEMKAGKNKPTKSQWEWIDYLRAQGYKVVICWSADEAIEAIKDYLR